MIDKKNHIPDEESGKVKVSETRRNFTKAGLIASPIVASLSARRAFGGNILCLSEVLSGNLSQPQEAFCVPGCSPGFWKAGHHWIGLNGLMPDFKTKHVYYSDTDQQTMNSYILLCSEYEDVGKTTVKTCPSDEPECKNKDKVEATVTVSMVTGTKFSDIFGGGSSVSLLTALCDNSSYRVERAFTAAYLNALTIENYVVSLSQLSALWTTQGGSANLNLTGAADLLYSTWDDQENECIGKSNYNSWYKDYVSGDDAELVLNTILANRPWGALI